MTLTKYKLGDLIECSTANNNDLKYGTDLIVGVVNDGTFSEPKGDVTDVNLKPYKIVNNGAFVYNPSRLDVGSIAYRTEGLCIVSHLYIVFYLNEKGKKVIDPDYLFMYFSRSEFRREVTFRNFGSQRPEFNFQKMCDIEISLPSMDTQKKYVNIYNAIVKNQKGYERGLEDLKLACDAYIDQLRKKMKHERIGDLISLVDKRNEELKYGIDDVRGVSIEKKFIYTKADMTGVSLRPYYIVEPETFAYVPVTSRNGEKISLAFNNSNDTYICSSSYIVFNIKDSEKLYPGYLRIFLNRDEFNRYARFNSWGSARETFDWSEMCDVEIPIPDITIQKAISELFDVYIERKTINEKLKAQIKDICPILIKGSVEEASA